MPWRIVTEEKDGTEAWSSSMTRDRAIAFAKDHLAIGIRIKRIETPEEGVIEGEELNKLLEEPLWRSTQSF